MSSVTINGEKVRTTAKKYSGGREDLFPDDVDDPELLVRALVRKLHGELASTSKRLQVVELNSGAVQKRAEIFKERYEEAKNTVAEFAQKLKLSERQIGEYQTKIAFLGTRWETLTGKTNEELSKDPHAAAKAYHGELRATQSELFSEKLAVKSLRKELDVWKATVQLLEGQTEKLYTEIVETRQRDQVVEQESIKIIDSENKAQKALADEQELVAEKTDEVKFLDKRVKDLQAAETSLTKEKQMTEKENMHMKRDVVHANEEYRAMEAKARETAATAKQLQKECMQLQALMKKQESEIKKLKEEQVEEKKWNKKLSEDLEKVQKELEAVKEERYEFFEKSKILEKDGNRERKRAGEAEHEAAALRTNIVDTSSRLVNTTRAFEDEQKQVKKLAAELVEVKAVVEEYKGVAASRLQYLQRAEEEIEQLKHVLSTGEGREYELKRELKKVKISLTDTQQREKESDAEVVRVAKSLDSTQSQYEAVQKKVNALREEVVELKKQLADSKADTRNYRQKSEQLEVELASTKVRVSDSENRCWDFKTDRDKWKQMYQKEEDNVHAVSDNVEVLARSLKAEKAEKAEALAREKALNKDIAVLKEKLQDAVEKGNSLEASLALVTGEKEDYMGRTSLLTDEVTDKKKRLRTTQSTLSETVTDLQGIKDSHDRLATQLTEFKAKHAAAEKEVARLDKELKQTKAKLRESEKEVSHLAASNKEVNEKLDDYALEASELRLQAKQMGTELKKRQTKLEGVEVEASFCKDSVARVCDDYTGLEAKFKGQSTENRRLAGEIEDLKKKLKDSDFEVHKLKDINWRIAQDLETSQISLRDSEAMVKRVTADMKAGKGRMTDAEAKNAELSANVNKLLEALQKAEADLAEALAGGTKEKPKGRKMKKTKSSSPERSSILSFSRSSFLSRQ